LLAELLAGMQEFQVAREVKIKVPEVWESQICEKLAIDQNISNFTTTCSRQNLAGCKSF
jgi:hypothetical protein